MFAIGFESVGLSFFRTKYDNIFSSDVNCFRITFLQLLRSDSDVPAIWKGWKRSANIFSSLVIGSHAFKSYSFKIPSIDHIEEENYNRIDKVRIFYAQLS